MKPAFTYEGPTVHNGRKPSVLWRSVNESLPDDVSPGVYVRRLRSAGYKWVDVSGAIRDLCGLEKGPDGPTMQFWAHTEPIEEWR